MKTRNWLAAGIVAITTLALAGCGGKGKEESAPEAAESAKDDFIYVAEYETLGEEGYMVGNVMSGDEGAIYFVGGKDDQTKLFVRKMDGSQEEIPVDLAENTVISVIGKDAEGNLLLGLVTYDQIGGMESKTENVTIRKISPDGTAASPKPDGAASSSPPSWSTSCTCSCSTRSAKWRPPCRTRAAPTRSREPRWARGAASSPGWRKPWNM